MQPIQISRVVEIKPWWKSKMMWVNLVAAGLVGLESATGLLQPNLPVNLYTALAVGLPVINAMLRVITTAPLSFGGRQP